MKVAVTDPVDLAKGRVRASSLVQAVEGGFLDQRACDNEREFVLSHDYRPVPGAGSGQLPSGCLWRGSPGSWVLTRWTPRNRSRTR